MDQPGWSGPEAAGIKVERRRVLFKVHVQPRATISVSVSGPRQRYSITWDTCWIVQYAHRRVKQQRHDRNAWQCPT
jgi:hypothetical protein